MTQQETISFDPDQAALAGPAGGQSTTLRYPEKMNIADKEVHWVQVLIFKSLGASFTTTDSASEVLPISIARISANAAPPQNGGLGVLANQISNIGNNLLSNPSDTLGAGYNQLKNGLSNITQATGFGLEQALDKAVALINRTPGDPSSGKERDLTSREHSNLRGLTTQIQGSVHLYFPGNFHVSYGMDYQDTDMVQVANIATIVGKDGPGHREALQEIIEQYGLSRMSSLAGGAASEYGINGLADSLNNAFSAVNRRVTNPQMELLFKQVKPREFPFNFVFYPRSINEDKTIREIIQLFAYNAHPKITSAGGRFLQYPSEFDINFMVNTAGGAVENKHIRRISRCVLTAIDIDYSPEKQAMLQSDATGATPAQIKLHLVFREVNHLDASLVKLGY